MDDCGGRKVPSHVRDFRYARYAMEGAECGGSDGDRFSYLMVWHPRLTPEPAHAWFREQMRSADRRL
ncbi:MAG: hypothetical protein AUI48_10180 [Chloroflexi bacterium 13_1_40CM_2_68_14]|nr:MAG: hypothetical protein AUI48_10180 [Chloroflexi bacterium 13_1_40CM_2_68_14]